LSGARRIGTVALGVRRHEGRLIPDSAWKTWHDLDVRVHRSFAFVDVSGFTALTELEGDERAVEVLTAFRALLREICSRRGVRIAKWLGDGVMLVCVETPPLLATILELHFVVGNVPGPAQSLSIRSGVTSGYVILMEGDDYIGHCVNVAARLCDLANGGEALASPAVIDYLPRWGLMLSHRDVVLRGVEKPVEAASIGMPPFDEGQLRDPICGLPLTEVTAEETVDDLDGGFVLFCSPGCLDIWAQRPMTSGAGAGQEQARPR
jgi:adenylate cyclase